MTPGKLLSDMPLAFATPIAAASWFAIVQFDRDPESSSRVPMEWTSVFWITMAVQSILAGVLGLLRMRGQEMSLRTRLIWAITLFMTGIPGLLAFVACRESTVRVACPACESLRLVDHDLCAKCGAAWPAPKRDGSEIFPAGDDKDLAVIV